MANVLVEESYLQGIANAIRNKNGTSDTYTPAQMATAISNISGGGSFDTPTLENGVLTFPTGHWVCNTHRERLILHDQPLAIY